MALCWWWCDGDGVYGVLLIKVPRCNRFQTGQFPIQIAVFVLYAHQRYMHAYAAHTASTSCTFERQCILGEVKKTNTFVVVVVVF